MVNSVLMPFIHTSKRSHHIAIATAEGWKSVNENSALWLSATLFT